MAHPTLVSIAVTPANPTVVLNATQQFTATGAWSDSTHTDLTATDVWASSNTNYATISAAGLATALVFGTTAISATDGAIIGTTNLSVVMSPVHDGCATCTHYDSTERLCRAHPPVNIMGPLGHIQMIWPSVDPEDWCGEHLPKSPVD